MKYKLLVLAVTNRNSILIVTAGSRSPLYDLKVSRGEETPRHQSDVTFDTTKDVELLLVPIPPLNEQYRITRKIENYLDSIDKMKIV